ncbi:hypothetical protein QIT50_gp28 [Pyrobaculum spherical virus 2]|uniref:Uncharacterized protein n=1 Tax=Pyrobaculum spherical virus 2 TaxID=2730632 RepID=A0A6M3VZ39_9VIRU|nr:hypothetical protein QIT50_gp28 [Pyrobaculum spherical virus 2]QJF12440.1 hypothetical protein PSV2_gp28 [Pyrobaculum spherical virus 2]
MRRIPIPLILAAVIAVGVTVTIIFQITVLTPPSAVVVLVPQGSSTVTYQFVAIDVKHAAFPIGMGLMQITYNTTNFYYYNVTELWSLAVPASRYINMTGTYSVNTGTRTYSFNVFDCGNVVVVGYLTTVYIGQWVDFGGFKVAVPVNFTASQDQLTCARKYMGYYNLAGVNIFSPRIDYYAFDGTYIYVYYDRVDTSTYYFRYDRLSYKPTTLSNNAVIGYKVTDPGTGVVYLGGFYVGAFSATSSGTYVVGVKGQ